MVAVGNTDINEFYIGEEPVTEIWNGSTLVWPEDPLLLSAIKIEIPESLRNSGSHYCDVTFDAPYCWPDDRPGHAGEFIYSEMAYLFDVPGDITDWSVFFHEKRTVRLGTKEYIAAHPGEAFPEVYLRGYERFSHWHSDSWAGQWRLQITTHTGDQAWAGRPILKVSGDIRALIDYNNPSTVDMPSWAFAELFSDTGDTACIGDASRLVLRKQGSTNGCYRYMFRGLKSLQVAPGAIYGDTVEGAACEGMFSGCTGLTQGVEYFPATTVGIVGCRSMYNGCTSLVSGVTPSDQTLPTDAYDNMFDGCSSLIQVKCPAISASGDSPLGNWLRGVAANGTLLRDKNSTLFYEGSPYVPNGWTVVNYN